MGLREEKKEATRAAIKDAALGRFVAQGFEATRVRDIAGQLRISEATFFNYFPSKERVLETAAAEIIGRSAMRLERALGADTPIRERFAAQVEAFADDIHEDRRLMGLVIDHVRLFGTGPAGEHHRRVVVAIMLEGQARGEIRSDVAAEFLGDCYEAMMRASVERWLAADSTEELVTDMRRAVDVLLSGCAT